MLASWYVPHAYAYTRRARVHRDRHGHQHRAMPIEAATHTTNATNARPTRATATATNARAQFPGRNHPAAVPLHAYDAVGPRCCPQLTLLFCFVGVALVTW